MIKYELIGGTSYFFNLEPGSNPSGICYERLSRCDTLNREFKNYKLKYDTVKIKNIFYSNSIKIMTYIYFYENSQKFKIYCKSIFIVWLINISEYIPILLDKHNSQA